MEIFKLQGLDYYCIAPTKEVAVMTCVKNKWRVAIDNLFEVESVGRTSLKIISFITCKKCGGHFKPSKRFVNSGAEFKSALECQNCGHSFIHDVDKNRSSPLDDQEEEYIYKTMNEELEEASFLYNEKRKQAIAWWNTISLSNKQIACHYKFDKERNYQTLTGREIQILWEDNNSSIVESQHLGRMIREPKELVDFDRVLEFIELLKESHNNWVSAKATDNMILFFNKLAESSSFAHLAHKKLKQ